MKETTGVMKKNAVLIPAAVLLLMSWTGCTGPADYSILTDPRIFVIDVENAMFNDAAAANAWERGLGLNNLTLTVYTRDAAGVETSAVQAVTTGDLVATYSCTRFNLSISGTLLRVEASGSTSTGTAYTAVINDKSSTDEFAGWTEFANCLKLKLGFVLDNADSSGNSLFFRVAPLGWSSTVLDYDAGVQAAGSGFTDRAGVLTAKQIAFQPRTQENPTGLTYDVYTAVIDTNIAGLYNEDMNLNAYYTDTPWSALWTYEEITSTGRNVAGTVYTLTRYTTAPCDILNPAGDGYESFLVDLTTSADTSITDKYMLIAIVLHYGSLSVPARVICADIQ